MASHKVNTVERDLRLIKACWINDQTQVTAILGEHSKLQDIPADASFPRVILGILDDAASGMRDVPVLVIGGALNTARCIRTGNIEELLGIK